MNRRQMGRCLESIEKNDLSELGVVDAYECGIYERVIGRFGSR